MIQINAAAMARWADGSSCMYPRPQIRDHGMASFAIGHALQVFSGIQLSVPAFMMSPEWNVNKAGALDGRRPHEKHRGRRGRDHRESNG